MMSLEEGSKPGRFKGFDERDAFKAWMRWAIMLAVGVCGVGILLCLAAEGCLGQRPRRGAAGGAGSETASNGQDARSDDPPELRKPVREAPAVFPPASNLPPGREIFASGPIDLATFNPTNDLVKFSDRRVAMPTASANREAGLLIHRAMEPPLRRLINLVGAAGGRLEIVEAYRPVERGARATSLHHEGRAVALTAEQLERGETLAKLAWQAGFDFVLHGVSQDAKPKVHASVRRDPDAPLPPRPLDR